MSTAFDDKINENFDFVEEPLTFFCVAFGNLINTRNFFLEKKADEGIKNCRKFLLNWIFRTQNPNLIMHVRIFSFLCSSVIKLFSFHPCFHFCVKCKIKAAHATPKKSILTNTVKSLGACQKKLFSLFLTSLLVVFEYNSFIPFWQSTSTFSVSVAFAFAMARHKFNFFSFIATSICDVFN